MNENHTMCMSYHANGYVSCTLHILEERSIKYEREPHHVYELSHGKNANRLFI